MGEDSSNRPIYTLEQIQNRLLKNFGEMYPLQSIPFNPEMSVHLHENTGGATFAV